MPDEAQTAGAVDTDVLTRIGQRLSGSRRFEKVTFQPEYAPNSVVAEYDLGYFPAAVERAYLRISWYETDDFNIHYSEQYESGELWECRWDRHPNEHNSREHFHPPPEADRLGVDTAFANDWREVLSQIMTELDERIKSFWD